jgi:XRE family transcriptional regulator, regulator of sulfur utilization
VPQPTSAQLGAAIRRVRESRGESIEAVAAKAGIHWTSVSRIETGKQNPTWDIVVSLADALEMEIAELAALAIKRVKPKR